MTRRRIRFPPLSLIALLLPCGLLAESARDPASAAGDAVPSPDGEPAARLIRYGPRDVVDVRTRLRYTTLIVLPEEERILDFVCGDKEYWVVDGVERFAYVKPAQAGARTNLNLIAASGNVYSFHLIETSDLAGVAPDLKLFVEPRETSLVPAARSAPRFVPADLIEDYRDRVAAAEAEIRETREAALRTIDEETARFRASYPPNLRFPYRFQAGKRPFRVTAMFHDGRFTYIRADPEEAPALYEVRDGQPSLVDFEFRDGVYIASKVLGHGYLAIGKARMNFVREED